MTETSVIVHAYVKAAMLAREFARQRRNSSFLSRYRAENEREARECFARAYGYIDAAKRIKEDSR